MRIRPAETRDTQRITALLNQVLEIHAAIRADIFISGTTKYTPQSLEAVLADENRRTYVAEDESGTVLGYVFCMIKEYPQKHYIVPHRELYIDDLCVDESARGQGVGKALFAHVKEQAALLGCHNITLNVWEGNDSAKAFYEKLGLSAQSTKMELIIEEKDNGKE